MKLSPETNIPMFLNAVAQCENEVIFTTGEKDILNLKSQLCRVVFAVISTRPEFIARGDVFCKEPKDLEIIKRFLI